MTIRGWDDVERIIEAQEVDRDGAEVQEPRESLIRMWIDCGSSGAGGRAVWRPRRYRVEAGDVVMVSDLPRWWVVDRDQATVRSWEEAAPGVSGADDVADPWFHLPDVSWLKRWRGVAVRGRTEVAGRPAVLVAARNTMLDIIPGSDRMMLALDLERGVLLRAECFLRDVLLGVEEVVEIAFDRPLSDDLFEQPGLQKPS